MKRWGAAFLTVLLLAQAMIPGSARADEDDDVRLYLNNGDVVSGKLVELGPELIIIKKNREVFTFAVGEVKRVRTLESLGEEAKMVPVRTFPRLGFLAGTFAGATLALWGFGDASSKKEEADDNARLKLFAREKELRDDADNARLIAWSATVAGVACLVVALIPERGKKRVFPDHVEVGRKSVKLAYVFRF